MSIAGTVPATRLQNPGPFLYSISILLQAKQTRHPERVAGNRETVRSDVLPFRFAAAAAGIDVIPYCTANTRLQESYTRYQQYSQRLTEARQRHTELAEGIRNHENELRVLKDEGYENTIAYAEAESRLDGLKQEYAANGEEVRKLEGQCNALQKTMQRNADAVSRAKTDLNNARAAVRETEAEIRKLSQQLKIQQSAWTQAGPRSRPSPPR